MKPIQYLQGDATRPQAEGSKILAHVCNDVGGWGAGFVLAISKRWPEPEANYRRWYQQGNGFQLGEVRFVPVEEEFWVANMIAQRGMIASPEGPPIRYEALESGLRQVANEAKRLGASVHMPRIGCGLAGGKWEDIEPIIERTLCQEDIDVFVYDFS